MNTERFLSILRQYDAIEKMTGRSYLPTVEGVTSQYANWLVETEHCSLGEAESRAQELAARNYRYQKQA